jgi:hypothetical protein
MVKRGEPSQVAETPANQLPEVRRARDFATVYSTSARVAYSDYDVRIFLGDVVFPEPSEGRDKAVVEERVCIVLPLGCACSLTEELQVLLDELYTEEGMRTLKSRK